MNKFLTGLTAIFLLLGSASAADNWTVQEHFSFDSYSKLNELVDLSSSANAKVVENRSFVSLTSTEGVVSLNTSYYQGVEDIDGIKVVTEQKDPLETDITGFFKETLVNGTITADLGQLILMERTKS